MNEYVSCRVASGQTRSEIIYEDAEVIGLMDICPIRPGHAQIISKHVTERVHRPLGGLRTAAIGDRLGQLVGGQPGASAAPLAAMTSSACSGVKRAPSGCIGTEDGRAGSAPVHIGRPAVGSGWMVPRGPGLSDGQSGHRRWLPAVVRR